MVRLGVEACDGGRGRALARFFVNSERSSASTASLTMPHQDRMSGLKRSLTYPYLGLNVQLCGLISRTGRSCKSSWRSLCSSRAQRNA